MTIILFDLGDSVWLPFQATGTNGNLAAPSGAVTVTIVQPDGTTALPTVTNTSVGRYETVFVPSQSGRHTVRWVAAGAEPSSYSDVFDVSEAAPRYIVSLDDARTLLRFEDTDSDEELRRYNAAATDMVERYLDQVVVRRAVLAEEHRTHQPVYETNPSGYYRVDSYPSGWSERRLFLHKRPIISLTSVRTVDNLYNWPIGQLYINGATAEVTPLPGSAGLWGDLLVDYVAGYQVIPANIQEAARIMIQHLWATRRGLGGNLITQQLPGFSIGFAIPQVVKDLLGDQPPVFA